MADLNKCNIFIELRPLDILPYLLEAVVCTKQEIQLVRKEREPNQIARSTKKTNFTNVKYNQII